MSKFKTTTIRLNKSDYNILKKEAVKENRSVNYIINKILTEYTNFGVVISEDAIKIDDIDIDKVFFENYDIN